MDGKKKLEYDADPRQVERLLEEMELEGEGVKEVVTPGLKVLAHQVEKEEPLPASEVTRFRALAARAGSVPCSPARAQTLTLRFP